MFGQLLADHWPVLAAIALSGFIKGLTGLGFTTLCLAFLANLIGLKQSLPLVIIPSITSNLIVMCSAGPLLPVLRRFWPLYASLLPGLLLGLWILGGINNLYGGALLGLVLVGYSLFALYDPNSRLPQKLHKPLAAPCGFLTGLFNGVTGSQVMPVMPYLLSLGIDQKTFVMAVNLSFTLSSLVMSVGLNRLDLFSAQSLYLSVVGLIPVFLMVPLGGLIRKRLSERTYRAIALLMLLFLGLNLVRKLFW